MRKNVSEIDKQFMAIHFDGLRIPPQWFSVIQYQTKRGTYPHLLAITILSEVCYRYTPQIVRKQNSMQIEGYEKNYQSEHAWQVSYRELSRMFGFTEDLISDALDLLCKYCLIERRYITNSDGANQMYLIGNPATIGIITNQFADEVQSLPIKRKGNSYSWEDTEMPDFVAISEAVKTQLGWGWIHGDGVGEFTGMVEVNSPTPPPEKLAKNPFFSQIFAAYNIMITTSNLLSINTVLRDGSNNIECNGEIFSKNDFANKNQQNEDNNKTSTLNQQAPIPPPAPPTQYEMDIYIPRQEYEAAIGFDAAEQKIIWEALSKEYRVYAAKDLKRIVWKANKGKYSLQRFMKHGEVPKTISNEYYLKLLWLESCILFVLNDFAGITKQSVVPNVKTGAEANCEAIMAILLNPNNYTLRDCKACNYWQYFSSVGTSASKYISIATIYRKKGENFARILEYATKGRIEFSGIGGISIFEKCKVLYSNFVFEKSNKNCVFSGKENTELLSLLQKISLTSQATSETLVELFQQFLNTHTNVFSLTTMNNRFNELSMTNNVSGVLDKSKSTGQWNRSNTEAWIEYYKTIID